MMNDIHMYISLVWFSLRAQRYFFLSLGKLERNPKAKAKAKANHFHLICVAEISHHSFHIFTFKKVYFICTTLHTMPMIGRCMRSSPSSPSRDSSMLNFTHAFLLLYGTYSYLCIPPLQVAKLQALVEWW